MKITKMGTAQLKKAIDEGKFQGESLSDAKAVLAQREEKAAGKTVPKASTAKGKKTAETKGEAKGAPAKKGAAPKTAAKKAPAKTANGVEKNSGVSELVRKLLSPKKGTTIAGCTFGEASRAVQEQFGRKLYPSEFDRNFTKMQKEGVLTERQPSKFKKAKEEVAPEEGGAE